MSILTVLESRIKDKSAIIGIVGLGYVGLPLALRYVEAGYRVVGFDVDGEKVIKLLNGETYISHISRDKISSASTSFIATTDFSKARDVDALILCVPTPLNGHRDPDLSFVIGSVDALLPYLRPGQIISLESTTYPGTTEEELVPRIKSMGFKIGVNFAIVFSPEREDPGNERYTIRNIPKVVGGITARCLKLGVELYGAIIDSIVPMSSTRAAEMTKLLENIHRAVNIGLVNEMKIVADKMGIDIHEVIAAAATKPFGFVPYYPGPGLGGHCIPIDPIYLTWKAREYGVNTRFIELAGEINRGMPKWVLEKVADALNDGAKSIKGSNILVLGISYKKNIDDMRESPALEIMKLLSNQGAKLAYSDPFWPIFPNFKAGKFDLKSVQITSDVIKDFDCVLLVTNHDAFDYELIQMHAHLIVDTRGVYTKPYKNVIKA